MVKGTPSMGRKSGKKNMIHCRRCGSRSYHASRKVCSGCGFGRMKKMRSYNWKKPGK